MHGEALHNDALNTALRESVEGLIRDKALRPALQPRVDMAEGYEQGGDANLTVEVEVLPDITVPSIDGLKLEKLTVAVTDEALDAALARIAEGQKSYTDAPKTKKAADGDQLIIDFVGSIDGVEFDGGKAENTPLVLGSGQFIPGFEEQLMGSKAGEEKTITVTFPADYPAANLAGKDAQFAITVQAVKVPGETVLDDEFAKNLGLESFDKLKDVVRIQLEQETAGLTRTQMKRQLLDTLAAEYDFAVPPTMVEAEFEQIWQQLQAEAAREEDPAAALAEIEADKPDYQRIAERRVRLGLLLSEIGQANGVDITSQEMSMLITQAAQQYRAEDRQRFVDYVRQDTMAQAQLRAPLYEDKVVDFLFDKAEVTERAVTREELEAAIEAEEAPAVDAKPAKAKKAPAKKAPAKKADGAEGEAEAKPAKKAPAKKAAAKK
jgi:trigger factor